MKYTTYFSICLALRRKKVYTLITVHSGKVVWKKDQIDNMEEEMKKMVKRTAVVTLAGVMSVGMLSGCGSKTLDGTKTVATVDGTDIPLGVVSLYAREQQQQTTTMYLNYMGSADNIWDQTAGDDSDETYGDQAVTSSLESVEKMYILKEKAADYNVELTDDDEAAIADAASQFMATNSEETIKELAVTEDQVKTLLELQTIQKKMYDPVVAEGKITVSDDEANQTTFTYVSYQKQYTTLVLSHAIVIIIKEIICIILRNCTIQSLLCDNHNITAVVLADLIQFRLQFFFLPII